MEKLPLKYAQREVSDIERLLAYTDCVLSKKTKFMEYALRGFSPKWGNLESYLYLEKEDIEVNRNIHERTKNQRISLENIMKSSIGYPITHKGYWESDIPPNANKIILAISETQYLNFVSIKKSRINQIVKKIKSGLSKKIENKEEYIANKIFKRIKKKTPIKTILKYLDEKEDASSIDIAIAKELILFNDKEKEVPIF